MGERLLITVKETQQILGLGGNAIYRLVKEEDFPSMKLDGKYYINKARLQEWIDSRCDEKY